MANRFTGKARGVAKRKSTKGKPRPGIPAGYTATRPPSGRKTRPGMPTKPVAKRPTGAVRTRGATAATRSIPRRSY